MGFVLSAAIFLTSTGFLVDAALAPTSPTVIVQSSTPGSSEGRTTVPQLSPEFSDEATTPSAGPRATRD
ncbi:hypothetical protein AWB68_07886 [Caballeronia choica]|jgi:hypothetical protein|uniref:Uncharacterized protein n=1 Tax=Caballeronia choica TaxID=326476 RepID=A0A158KY04_9BURK|nr:hypothetical protein AWB68_07886 [Caballeronia choica]